MPAQTAPRSVAASVKDSIRDLAHLQRTYNPSDEILWAYFNARVLLNKPIAVDDFVREAYTSGISHGRLSTAEVE
jgi:hypothetical protein